MLSLKFAEVAVLSLTMGCCSSTEVSELKHDVCYGCFKNCPTNSQRGLGQRHVFGSSGSLSYNNNNNICLLVSGAVGWLKTAPRQSQQSRSQDICVISFLLSIIYALAEQTWLETAGGAQLHGHPMAHHIHLVLYWDGKFSVECAYRLGRHFY